MALYIFIFKTLYSSILTCILEEIWYKKFSGNNKKSSILAVDNAIDLAVLSIQKGYFISVCLLTPLSVNCFLIHSHKNRDLKPNESMA